MDFRLSDEHDMIRSMVRDFAEREVAKAAAERDAAECFDIAIFKKMAQLGLTGMPWSERYGGMDCDDVAYCIAIEELSRSCAATGITLFTHTSLASWPIDRFAKVDQKQKYLKPLAQGIKIGAYGLMGSVSKLEIADMVKTSARLDGKHYLLNGSERWLINGGIADIYIVFALSDPSDRSSMTAFIIEKECSGFSIGKQEWKLGVRAASTAEVIFTDCKVPIENMLGEVGDGYEIAKQTMGGFRIGVAAQAVGIAQAALDAAVSYAKERKQFGKPLADNQGISFKLADMAMGIEAARLLTYQAAWLRSAGLPSGREAAMSKLMACDIALKVTIEAVQVFGGYGYTKDYPVERLMRDAKMLQIYGGSQESQQRAIVRLLTE